MTLLTRYNPQRDLLSFHDEVSRLFEGLSGLRAGGEPNGSGFVPPVDVREDDEAYLFQLDLPGLDPKDVKIEMSGDLLSVRGERKSQTVTKERDVVHRVERVSGTFERTFRLAAPVDTGKIRATYRNGVLDLHVPKLEQARTREIAIEIA